jgi:hypothetical protein
VTGSAERRENEVPQKVKEVMVLFDVDDKKARQLLGCSSVLA